MEYWTFGFARCGFRTLLFDDDIARVFILLLLEAKSSFFPTMRFRRRDEKSSSREESEELTKDWSSETNALPLCRALFDKEEDEVQILIDEDIRE